MCMQGVHGFPSGLRDQDDDTLVITMQRNAMRHGYN